MDLLKHITANLSHPSHGWKTTHFWGPIANWGIVLSAVYDASFKSPGTIDVPMTLTLIGYSSLFMRFAWQVGPRNYLLFACHAFNVTAQLNQLRRAIQHKLETNKDASSEVKAMGVQAGVLITSISALIIFSGRFRTSIGRSQMNEKFKNFILHPAGPLTIFFWAPTSKWLLSANNLLDLEKPTEKISISQQTALTLTGFIWTRYATVINPINYNLATVNVVLGTSSGYHLVRKIKSDYL